MMYSYCVKPRNNCILSVKPIKNSLLGRRTTKSHTPRTKPIHCVLLAQSQRNLVFFLQNQCKFVSYPKTVQGIHHLSGEHTIFPGNTLMSGYRVGSTPPKISPNGPWLEPKLRRKIIIKPLKSRSQKLRFCVPQLKLKN